MTTTASALLLLAAVAGCGGNESGRPALPAVHPDSSATVLASRMAAVATPAEAAGAFAGWMSEADVRHVGWAHTCYTALADAYGTSAPEFSRVLDSIFRASPDPVRARMLALSASPERVAAVMRADSTAAALRPELLRVYRTDSAMLRRFVVATRPRN